MRIPIKVPQRLSVLILAAIMVVPPLVFGAETRALFPFKTTNELFEANDGMVPAGCPGEPPIGVSIDSKDLTPGNWWRVGLHGQRFFAAEIREQQVVQVVFGRIIDERFVVTEIYSLEAAQARYPGGPCDFLTQRDA